MALDITIRNQLQDYMARLVSPIKLLANVDESASSQEMLGMLEEVTSLSEKITLNKETDVSKRIPSFEVNREIDATGITFAGIPSGHEFTSFVLALLQAGGHPLKLDAEKIEQIKNIQGKFHFETYISLSCHNCPDVVQALNAMSIINSNISHTMIDGALFQKEVEDKQIMAVPTIFLNGEPFGQGRMELDEIVNKIDSSASLKEAEKISKKETYDILIVGGGPAGASAAIYSARKGIRTGIVSERFGGQVMDTLGIENFISVKATEGPKLVTALEEHVKEYEVDIMNLQRAKSIQKNDENALFEVELENGGKLKSKSVIVATGARWRELNVPGEKEFKGKGVAYCPHCDGPLFKGKHVAVIGGGNSGVEAAIDLANIVGHVTLFEFAGELKADDILQKRLYSLSNVDVILNAQTLEVLGSDKVNSMIYLDRKTNEKKTIALEGIFIQIGLLPNTDFVKNTVDLSKFGEIIIDSHGQSSLPGLFAAGDVTTVPYKQIIIAMGEGAKASLGAFDYLIRQ
ncbi:MULTISPECIES: alkyl hydroperoxide reductase subunit F [Candidatus Methylopumilus]|jgi:alkyl hydroperoxide reductase subunit F|uniref:Alkyl hydroperoxide reductase subunit F n=1 Tax=Candidatus Methylopumilus universalis TaxID=2588536 RepID=A0ABX5VTF4_9PROT|nr:alkyl hydroperoxide reductase subunit F [Candidatus Methylopumilus universalis]QDC45573.1 alkyl hydroperoxide reductase subunit F [Candidatus Methylopumilus universalis]QDC50586.1 alkyl hydroperoxide reductase subunit F [Candidatus Methylopumilus universalis]QDC60720.1 alkyl hydroperoxide reductase subunit F [Candidatus Methylopumilus universalis]QDC98482.1 alkyl hydroperoxide reductase subunit F [Candidatus Methylopumilus universalis]